MRTHEYLTAGGHCVIVAGAEPERSVSKEGFVQREIALALDIAEEENEPSRNQEMLDFRGGVERARPSISSTKSARCG